MNGVQADNILHPQMPGPGKEPVLEVKGLNIILGNTRVIEDGDFCITQGDYVGIVGPNGGGKTTLLRAILGFLPRERGKIALFGQDIDDFNQWHRIAHVPQNAIHFDNQFPLSVRELVSLGRVRRSNIFRRLNKEDWQKVDDSMEFMGISDLADRRIGQLSGGQKQRVFVAKALALDPELLILDEPLSGMDAEAQERFYKKLSNLNKERGTTIVVVSHDIAAVFCRMNRIVCINRRIYCSDISTGPEEVLRKAYGDHFRFLYHQHDCEGAFNGV